MRELGRVRLGLRAPASFHLLGRAQVPALPPRERKGVEQGLPHLLMNEGVACLAAA